MEWIIELLIWMLSLLPAPAVEPVQEAPEPTPTTTTIAPSTTTTFEQRIGTAIGCTKMDDGEFVCWEE